VYSGWSCRQGSAAKAECWTPAGFVTAPQSERATPNPSPQTLNPRPKPNFLTLDPKSGAPRPPPWGQKPFPVPSSLAAPLRLVAPWPGRWTPQTRAASPSVPYCRGKYYLPLLLPLSLLPCFLCPPGQGGGLIGRVLPLGGARRAGPVLPQRAPGRVRGLRRGRHLLPPLRRPHPPPGPHRCTQRCAGSGGRGGGQTSLLHPQLHSQLHPQRRERGGETPLLHPLLHLQRRERRSLPAAPTAAPTAEGEAVPAAEPSAAPTEEEEEGGLDTYSSALSALRGSFQSGVSHRAHGVPERAWSSDAVAPSLASAPPSPSPLGPCPSCAPSPCPSCVLLPLQMAALLLAVPEAVQVTALTLNCTSLGPTGGRGCASGAESGDSVLLLSVSFTAAAYAVSGGVRCAWWCTLCVVVCAVSGGAFCEWWFVL